MMYEIWGCCFGQFVGTLGPLIVGALHEAGWALNVLLLLFVSLPLALAGALFMGLAIANPEGCES